MTLISTKNHQIDNIQANISDKKFAIHPEHKYIAYIDNGIHNDTANIISLPICEPVASVISSSILKDTSISFTSIAWISYPSNTSSKRKKSTCIHLLCIGTNIGTLIIISPENGTVVDTISLITMVPDNIINDQVSIISLQSSHDSLWIGTDKGWIVQFTVNDRNVITTFHTKDILNGMCITNNGSYLISWHGTEILVWELSHPQKRSSRRNQGTKIKVIYQYSHIDSILDITSISHDQCIEFAFVAKPDDQFIHIHTGSLTNGSINWDVETLVSTFPIKHIFASSLLGSVSNQQVSLWKRNESSWMTLTTMMIRSKTYIPIATCFEFAKEQMGLVIYHKNALKLELCKLTENCDKETIIDLEELPSNSTQSQVSTLTTPYTPLFDDRPLNVMRKRREKKQYQLELIQQKSVSLSAVLSQAIQLQDKQMLDMVLNSSQHGANDSSVIVDSTISQLGAEYIAPLLSQLVSRLYNNPIRSIHLFHWIKAILMHHTSVIWTIPELENTLSKLKNIMEERIQSYDSLQRLSGRLEWVLCSKEKSKMKFDDIQPEQIIQDANE